MHQYRPGVDHSDRIHNDDRISHDATVVAAAPEVDVGVDLESGILQLAVVGPVSDDLWRGHFEYWDSVNDDLGGVGGQFLVELVRVEGMSDAAAIDVLAASLVASGVELDGGVAVLAASPIESEAPSSLNDVTRGDEDAAFSAARQALLAGSLPYDVSDFSGEVLLADERCTEFGDTLEIDRQSPTAIEPDDSPAVFYLCVDDGDSLTVSAEALGARPGSLLVFSGVSWRPELAQLLDGSEVVVAGYVPGPGVEGAPAAEVMGIVLGADPWTDDLVDGYTAALSMHLVLEAAAQSGELTRSAVIDAAATVDASNIGFGPGVMVGLLDPATPTGVAFELWQP